MTRYSSLFLRAFFILETRRSVDEKMWRAGQEEHQTIELQLEIFDNDIMIYLSFVLNLVIDPCWAPSLIQCNCHVYFSISLLVKELVYRGVRHLSVSSSCTKLSVVLFLQLLH